MNSLAHDDVFFVHSNSVYKMPVRRAIMSSAFSVFSLNILQLGSVVSRRGLLGCDAV
jgi:hypothetical protein